MADGYPMQSQLPHAIPERCGASTRGGGVCRARPMPNGRCRMHGGKSPAGVAHPGFKTGAHSRYALPGALGERYARHSGDLDYIALRDELAMVTGMIEEFAAKLDTLRPPPEGEFDKEEREARDKQIQAARKQLAEWIDLRRVLAATEAQRVKLAQDSVSREQTTVFAAAVLEAVRRHVRDPQTVMAIQGEVQTILASAGATRA